MANNYIPGFTPSLHGRPVKRMALGGRMEGDRLFRERDDTIDFEAVGNPLGNLQNTLSNLDANSILANYNNIAPTADTYQMQPTQQPVQTAAYTPSDYSYDPYNIGNYGAQPTAAPSYQSQPTAQPVQTAPYYGDYSYDPYGIGNFDLSSYQMPTPQMLTPRVLQEREPDPYYVDPGEFDPVYSPTSTKVTEPLKIQAASPLPPQSQPTTAVPYVDYSEPSATSLPAQTVASNEYAPLDLGNWNPSMVNLGNLNLLSDPGPAYDPNSVVRFDTGAKIGVPDANGGFTYQNAAPVVAQPGTTYTLTDYSGNILGQGSTVDEIQKLVALADQNAVRGWNLYQGDPVAGGQLFKRSPQDNTLKNMLIAGATAMGAGFLGPYIQGAGAIAPGAVGAAATPLGAGLAAGAVNTAANLATGANIVDALKSGAMAGLSSAAMTGLLGGGKTPNVGDLQARAIDTADLLSGLGINPSLANQIASGPVSSIGSAGGGGAIGSAIPGSSAGSNLIQVIGSKGASNIPTSFFTNALGAASGALSGVNYGDQVWNRPAAQEAEVREPGSSEFNPEEGIVVKAGKYDIPFDPTSILNQFLTADYTGSPDYSGYEDLINKYNDMYDIQGPEEEIPEGSDEGWTVEAPKENVVLPPPASLPELFPPLNSVDIPTDLVKEWPEIPAAENEIVVPGYPPRAPDLLPVFVPPINSVNIPPADTFKPSDTASDAKSELDKIIDKIKAGSTLASLVGAGAAAAAGSGGKSSFSGARGPLNPIFSAKLPKPNMRMAMPRALNFDAYRYGYGPEQSFFTNVPQGGLNTSTAYTGYGTSPRYNATEQYASDFAALAEAIRKAREEEELKRDEAMAAAKALGLTGYAEGGFAVGGPGDGREDKIPAMLSDGEYVIDAETVAMLGNGSNKAGAEALDNFRVNIRKHKGRKLSKGKFSVDAKKPEQYLKGRK